MALGLGFELRDFDLERVGFSLSILDEGKKRQVSEGYLRMSLEELAVFLQALRAAPQDIEMQIVDGGSAEPPSAAKAEPEAQSSEPAPPGPRPRR
jgi:hypothetical protein